VNNLRIQMTKFAFICTTGVHQTKGILSRLQYIFGNIIHHPVDVHNIMEIEFDY